MNSPAPKMPVRRDHAWVEREYNREKYPRILAAAREALSAGERNLARLVGQVCARERGEMVLGMHNHIVLDAEIVRAPLLYAIGGIGSVVNEALAEACVPKTATIVELGAGWGRNLLLLHLSGRISATACLHALEFAETARMAGTLIAGVSAGLAFKASAFDYHAPDYSMIEPSTAPAIVATVHSIEQIPKLKPDVFLKLMERLPNLRGVHLEPVSFQLPPERRGLRAALTSKAYADHHDYNRNLWAVLSALEAEDKIVIEEVAADIVGLNPKNPSTLILWRATTAQEDFQ